MKSLAQELTAFEAHRVTVAGPQVQITFDLARSLAMIVHELLTKRRQVWSPVVAIGSHRPQLDAGGRLSRNVMDEVGGPALKGAPQQLGLVRF